jgi:hypothetical protein
MEDYSGYGIETFRNIPGYDELCKCFLSLTSEENQEMAIGILFGGGYDGYNTYGGMGRDNPMIQVMRRAGLAYQIVMNPDTFKYLKENNVVYYHGTSSLALPGILRYGLNSVDKSMSEGIELKTGEEWSRISGKRSFVSFTDLLDIAIGYSHINGDEDRFPIIIGTTYSNVRSVYGKPLKMTDIPEVTVETNFPRNLITCIMVPSDKVEMVQAMAEDIPVLPARLEEIKFYNVDYDININNDIYQELIGKNGYSK